MRSIFLPTFLLIAACEKSGVSSEDVREAAIERARSEFAIPAQVPVDARVWVGGDYDGEITVCGLVSSAGPQLKPKRFLASVEPFEWLIFEDAHDAMLRAEPPAAPSWGAHCAPGVSLTPPTSENNPCGTPIDSNQNGVIEEVEYQSFGFAFDNWDISDDYSVSEPEFRRCWARLNWGSEAQKMFAAFDRDGDAALSQKEFFAPEKFEQFSSLVTTR